MFALGIVLLALGVLVGRWFAPTAAQVPGPPPSVACFNLGERLKTLDVSSIDEARGAGLAVSAAAVPCFTTDTEQNAFVKQLEAVNFATDPETARAALQRASEMLGAAR
jgi:hypothetical protein